MTVPFYSSCNSSNCITDTYLALLLLFQMPDEVSDLLNNYDISEAKLRADDDLLKKVEV